MARRRVGINSLKTNGPVVRGYFSMHSIYCETPKVKNFKAIFVKGMIKSLIKELCYFSHWTIGVPAAHVTLGIMPTVGLQDTLVTT